jgi:methyl-accepting chemotaxis protein
MTGMVTQSVAALQALVGRVESVDAASGSIGRAIADQESIAAQVATSLESMHGIIFLLSREIREAAQIAANSGMLSDLVLETANSVDGLMHGIKEKLRDIGTGIGPGAGGQVMAEDAPRQAAIVPRDPGSKLDDQNVLMLRR